jgi:hypothetical protein
MKKLIPILIIVLTLSGCISENPSKTLVEIGGEASCVAYEVQDENGQAIKVSQDVVDSLSCATGAVKLSPNGDYLLFDYENSLNLYDFDGTTNQLMPLEDDLEGISCVWHDLNEMIACALVNQQKYEGGTKFVVINLDGDVAEYDITSDRMADFVCGASCYPGEFWFEDENILKYKGHNIVAPGEVFEIQLQ